MVWLRVMVWLGPEHGWIRFIIKKSRNAEIRQIRFFIYQNPFLVMAKSLSRVVTKYCVEVCWAVTKYQVEVGLSVTKY